MTDRPADPQEHASPDPAAVSHLERARSGRLYGGAYGDRATSRQFLKARLLVERYNATSVLDFEERRAILHRLFGSIGGEGCFVEPPFHCDYGCNVSVGAGFYANAGCVLLDCAPIAIGDNVLLGPQVGLYTPSHPIDAAARSTGVEQAKPIVIGSDVWIGGHATVCPGVTVGDDVVIGAGSVVTHDIPSHVVAVGNPCRVLRPITEEDRTYWQAEVARYEAEMEALGAKRRPSLPDVAAEVLRELEEEGMR